MTTGQRLRAAREAAGMTQAELAVRARVQLRQISRWESDEDEPKVRAFKRAAIALGKTMDELVVENE